MPYVEYDKCVSGLPDEFKPFITNDKICAGYNNGKVSTLKVIILLFYIPNRWI